MEKPLTPVINQIPSDWKDDLDILLVEDNPSDVKLLTLELRKFFNLTINTVDNKPDFISQLQSHIPDIILSDYSLPQFDGLQALLISKDMCQDVPFILVTISRNEEVAVEVMKSGADDYILKENLSRLEPAIVAAIEKRKIIRSEKEAVTALAKNNKLLQDMVDSSTSLIYVADLEGKLILVNRQIEKVFDKPKEELVGKPKNRFLTQFAADPSFTDDSGIIGDRKTVISEISFRQPDGMHFFYAARFPLIDEENNLYATACTMTDITERIIAEAKIKEYTEQLQGLTAHLDNIREEERVNLARDLHDILGSSLTGLKMDLTVLEQNLEEHYNDPHPVIGERVKAMYEIIDGAIGLMRKLVRELRPGMLEELGLAETVIWYANEVEERSGIRFDIGITPPEMEIDLHNAVILFRIFQEIVTNIVRHSQASEACVRINKEGRMFTMVVTDNGVGISREEIERKDAYGVLGMKERVLLLKGKIDISGAPGKGTTIRVEVPFDENEGSDR